MLLSNSIVLHLKIQIPSEFTRTKLGRYRCSWACRYLCTDVSIYVYTLQTHTTLILCHIFIHHLGPFPRPTTSLIYTFLSCRLAHCFIFLVVSSMQQVNTATALSSKLFLSHFLCTNECSRILDIYTWLSHFPLLCDRWLFMLLLRDFFWRISTI